MQPQGSKSTKASKNSQKLSQIRAVPEASTVRLENNF